MKLKKTFSWLGILIILTSILLIVPTAMALAATFVTSPSSGTIGQTITISGSGFSPTSPIGFYLSSQNIGSAFPKIDTEITTYKYLGSLNSDVNGVVAGAVNPIPASLNDGASAAAVT